jgi:nitrogenase molybdenum-iron protein alpha/beta subunit
MIDFAVLFYGEPDHVFRDVWTSAVQRNYVVDLVAFPAVGVVSLDHESVFGFPGAVSFAKGRGRRKDESGG